MEASMKELIILLQEGPLTGKETICLNIFEVLLSCTSQKEGRQHFSEDLFRAIIKFTGIKSYNGIIYKILTNIFSDEELNAKLCFYENTIFTRIVNMMLKDIMNENSAAADSACMLLSNVTRIKQNCENIMGLESLSPFSYTLHQMVSTFTVVKYNLECNLDYLALVLCNFSQLSEVRELITRKDECILQKLVPFINHESLIRRRGIVGVVHNCAFDSRIHQWMFSNEVDILPYILLPLAGPEQFDEEDNNKLPIDLQYLPESKRREFDLDIRKLLLETLNQLCATKFGRQFMRDQNVYIILRELHKWEQHPHVLLACENVVDILIRTEEEIGVDELKSIEIPQDLKEKFSKEMQV